MKIDIFDRLKEFTISQSAVNDEEITRETKLAEDLGVYGDDAVDFIIAYSKFFNVDVTKFMAADYFRAEGGIKLPSFLTTIFDGDKKKELTVGHLEKGILAGRLDEEVINS
ncbi:MAG: DUF1493 family protein [Flavihumibacter sp.]|nr:DUF1493 family protein [Flavihumibacter sp.]